MSVPPGRPARRLTAPQILLISVVSALVLLLIVLLVQRAAGGGEADGAATGPSAAAPTTDGAAPDAGTTDSATDGAADDESATPPPTDETAAYFAAPSGNIACALTVDSADCVIASFSYEPTDAADCDDDSAGGHLRVEAAGASMPCDPLVVVGDVAPLAYGSSITEHGFTCDSEETGVTCRHDESGYGFSVARADYDLF